MAALAAARVEEVLSNHEAEPLEPRLERDIDRIVMAARAELAGQPRRIEMTDPKMNGFALEISQQPGSLRGFARYYHDNAPHSLERIPRPPRPVFSGMGASYHAGVVAARHLQSRGVPAVALQASDLIHYGRAFFTDEHGIIYVSQSGASAEVSEVLDACPSGKVFIGITNESQSPLAAGCLHPLPLMVDSEKWVATKTYLNTVAVLWWLARAWSGTLDGHEAETLLAAADRVEAILAEGDAIADSWLSALGSCASLTCVGYGPHMATALQCAQTMTEWAKVPVLGIGGGALRHGFVETADDRAGYVVFASAGKTQAQALRLAEELRGYGATVLTVMDGVTVEAQPSKRTETGPVDEFLAPLLDVIPAQLFTEALARQRGIAPGFRHISKVITHN
jgi:glucosamine--fructose-6-phosphate aminotransferase (isomerizing)